jgi:tellurite resistance protein
VSEIRDKDQFARGGGRAGQTYDKSVRLRVTPNRFGIPLGLAGLATAWHAAGAKLGTPSAVPGAIDILAAIVLLLVGWRYAAQGLRRMAADLRDPIQAPFLAMPAITGMMLGAALASVSFAAGRVLVVVFLAVTIGVGGWLGGQWITGGIDPASVHSGYYLPTIAGGLVGAITLSQVHLHALAEASFGVGVVSWVILGSVVLNRLITASRLPAALQPVTAIELAPPALAGVAWFALAGGGAAVIAYAIGGYLALMALVQVRLIPVYRKLRFSPGFWAFTFSYAIAITCALEWITRTNPPGATGYAIAAITAITLFIGAIAARTLMAIVRGQFLAEPAGAPPSPRVPMPGPLPARKAASQPRHTSGSRLRPAASGTLSGRTTRAGGRSGSCRSSWRSSARSSPGFSPTPTSKCYVPAALTGSGSGVY